MISKVVEFKRLLNQHKYYDISKLKEELNVDDEHLIVLISKTIGEDIDHFNDYSSFDDYKNLYKCLNYLNDLINQNINLKHSKIMFELKKIYHRVEETIRSFEKSKKQGIYAPNEYVFDRIKDEIIKIIKSYNPNAAFIIDDNESNIYPFLKHLIFDVKKFSYIEGILEKFPNLVNIKRDDVSLFDEVVDEYINQTMIVDNDHYLIYLKKVIDYIMNSSKFEMENRQRRALTNKLLNTIDNLKRIKINRKEKEKKKYFLVELINNIKNTGISNFKEKIENINHKYNISNSFKEYTLEPLSKIKGYDGIYYHDLRDKYTVTIDSSNNGSFDDAFSVEVLPNGHYLVGIYISDVSAYVKAGTYLDMEAYARGRTIYLPDDIIPMFPEILTYDTFSLKQNNNRLAIAHLFEFSPNMDLINYEILRSLINVNRNLSYNEVDNILNKGKDIKEFKAIGNMLKITEKLHQENASKTVYHELKGMRRCVNSLENKLYEERTGSRIVEELMVLVNHFIANTFYENNLPFIYRINQSKYDFQEVKKLKKIWNSNAKIEQIINCINNTCEPSTYSVNNVGHYGLNLCAYGHTTNPIRGYVSLVNQRLVKKFLIDGYKMSDHYYYKLEERLGIITNQMNEKNQLYEDYAREYGQILVKKRKRN